MFIIEILLIPIISNKLERVFLGECRIILWERIQLRVKTVQKTAYIKSWYRSRILKEEL